jgi:glycosyltransferase involved in cell wall biosynthesis
LNIQLPKLRKIGVDRPKKKKIFLICDSIEFASGVATAAKELVVGTCDKYDWVQLGAALQHPNHGKIVDLSQEIEKETGFENVYCKIYCHNGYGNQDVIREIIHYEKPDLLLLITDPRFFGHVFQMEYELRTVHKIPVSYLNIWDSNLFALWNASAYASCDLLMSINRQTKVVNQEVLKYHGTKTTDIDKPFDKVEGTLLSYVPHGSNPKYYFKETPESHDWNDYQKFKEDFLKKHDVDFIVFFNSRNIRRKQPGDIILSFRRFCDQLPPEKAKRCALVMKTAIMDENGTDLMAVKKAICPKYKVLFNQDMIPAQVMNWFYNLADCTFFMSSAEGFGLAGNESLHAGTMLIAPVTGGLQDQMKFEDENGKWIEFNEEFTSNHRGKYKKCGKWAYPIFPRTRALQGSIPTPYIFDDYSDAEDAATGLKFIYDLGKEERDRRGLIGREWVMSEESGMNAKDVCKRFVKSVETLFSAWQTPKSVSMVEVQEKPEITADGIVW